MVKQLKLKLKLRRKKAHHHHRHRRQEKVSSKPKVMVVYSNYSFKRAVDIQMSTRPQINYGTGWYNASRSLH